MEIVLFCKREEKHTDLSPRV